MMYVPRNDCCIFLSINIAHLHDMPTQVSRTCSDVLCVRQMFTQWHADMHTDYMYNADEWVECVRFLCVHTNLHSETARTHTYSYKLLLTSVIPVTSGITI